MKAAFETIVLFAVLGGVLSLVGCSSATKNPDFVPFATSKFCVQLDPSALYYRCETQEVVCYGFKSGGLACYPKPQPSPAPSPAPAKK